MGLYKDILDIEKYYSMRLRSAKLINEGKTTEQGDYKTIFEHYRKKNALLNSACKGDCTLEWALEQVEDKMNSMKKRYLPFGKKTDSEYDQLVEDLGQLLEFHDPLLKTGDGKSEMRAKYTKKSLQGGAVGGLAAGTVYMMSQWMWFNPYTLPLAVAGSVGYFLFKNAEGAKELKKRYDKAKEVLTERVRVLDRKIKNTYHSGEL